MEIISNSKTDLTSYFDKISTSWYKAAKSIIETGIMKGVHVNILELDK